MKYTGTQLRNIFQSPFNLNNWQKILINLFQQYIKIQKPIHFILFSFCDGNNFKFIVIIIKL